MKIWITDSVGYDVRGGMAEPFSSLAKAAASLGWTDPPYEDHGRFYQSKEDADGSNDCHVIYALALDGEET